MRPWSIALVILCAAAIAPAQFYALLASAASIVLESLPFLVLGRLGPFLGCGCGARASARSVPAALATAALFGLPAALARFVAAIAVGAAFPVRDEPHPADLADELVRLAPAALLGGVVATALPHAMLRGWNAFPAFGAGAMLGFVASPCALGGVALAAALRAQSPAAAAGVLCTAGIVDLYGIVRWPHHHAMRDSTAYTAIAAACIAVALQHGAALVHPRMTLPLAAVALYCIVKALRLRRFHPRIACGIALATLAATLAGTPVPPAYATETTLSGAYAGEAVAFTGVVSAGYPSALVRYAIVCCRADAAPVSVMVNRDLSRDSGRWMRVAGTLEMHGGALQLRVAQITRVAPPADPFVYW